LFFLQIYRIWYISGYTYILILVFLPLNGNKTFLNNTFIIMIRLDYIFHILLFLPFALLLQQSMNTKIITSLFLGCLFASFCEIIQYFLPYRAFNINDLLANFLGIFLGVIIAIFSQKCLIKKAVKTN